jgi:hypothetical protein
LKALKDLQLNALEKLESRKEFQKTGLATVKVRAPFQFGTKRIFNVQIKLTDCGSDLIENIAKNLDVDKEKYVKLFSGTQIAY